MQFPNETKTLELTKHEAEVLCDQVRVTNPQTRSVALKLAGLVMEFEADEAIRQAATLTEGGNL